MSPELIAETLQKAIAEPILLNRLLVLAERIDPTRLATMLAVAPQFPEALSMSLGNALHLCILDNDPAPLQALANDPKTPPEMVAVLRGLSTTCAALGTVVVS